MPRICVGIWCVATESKQWGVLDFEARMKKLENAIQQFKDSALFRGVNGSPNYMAQALTGIFLAPEYLFMNPFTPQGSTPDEGKQLDSFYVTQLHKHMETVTHGTRILVVPGTIASRQRIDAAVRKEHVQELQAQLWALGHNSMRDTYSRANIENQKELLEATLRKLQQARTNGSMYAARNTAYGYLGGRQVLSYHKRTEVGEVFNDSSIFVNGVTPGLLTLDGKRIGVEVCKDSSQGYVQALQGGIDLQIVLSTDDHHQVRNHAQQQYLLMATPAVTNTGGLDSGVYQGGPRLAPTTTLTVKGFSLLLYQLDVV